MTTRQKARKRPPQANDSLIEAQLRQFTDRYNRIRKTWLENVEAAGHRMLKDGDLPPEDLADAREITVRCDLARRYRSEGSVDDAMIEAFHVGRAVERVNARPRAAIGRQEAHRYAFLPNGSAGHASPQEGKLLRFFDNGASSASIADIRRAVWSEPHDGHTPGKLHELVRRLNAKLAGGGMILSVEGDQLVAHRA